MKVLIVKTSSLGDIVHALPAVTEASHFLPSIQFDWLVEEAFCSIPSVHPSINNIIPVSLRKWRRNISKAAIEIPAFVKKLRSIDYDLIIDSQGLLKSGVLSVISRGKSVGFDIKSSREKAASFFYTRAYRVAKTDHAILRQKSLFAQSLGYRETENIDYGLDKKNKPGKKVIFFHGTTSRKKEWPEKFWGELVSKVISKNWEVIIPALGHEEVNRAQRISQGRARVIVDSSIQNLMEELDECAAAVSVDTGLGHLANAFSVPSVGIFGVTSPKLTGLVSPSVDNKTSINLRCSCAKCSYQEKSNQQRNRFSCYQEVTPERVWRALQRVEI